MAVEDQVEELTRKDRRFLPNDFEITTWQALKPYYDKLLERNPDSKEALREWFRDRSELEAVVSEDLGWRYIRMTCDTTDEEATKAYQYFVTEIDPNIAPLAHEMNRKVLENPHLEELKKEEGYDVMVRGIEKEFTLFREENIPLNTEIQTNSQKFAAITGAMSVTINGQEYTLQQANDFLYSLDREVRENAYRKVQDRRLQDREKLDALFDTLVKLRDQVAKNADKANYRDYMFESLGRFDYTPQDCFQFHESVLAEAVPVKDQMEQQRKEQLGVDELRPWDKQVNAEGKESLKPFKGGADLLDRTITCFSRLDPYLGSCLETMKEMGHLDLESRKGKAPGGYNYPLLETGVPFIFMNATSTLRDLVTMLHEGGHAVHSFLTKNLEIKDFKDAPSEIAELASMSMELLSMDHWDVFFDNEEDLKRAKKEHLEQIIDVLPWVACIDKFQHWIYENPGHTDKERADMWLQIYEDFSDDVTDWSDLELNRRFAWQKQLHLFEVPFYYIEYGFAQLGAIAVWKNYRENPEKGLQGYLNALKLGYTQSIPEVYEAAGIKFDFRREYIRELMQFVRTELEKAGS
ncbi:M3 family oligoendopeptidase [Roseivirga sp. BDSF3-8]|uniref:M3 family oligoendopeptidase n=1 Tax=Roseivirga sp. BDSF3-8 TaxID=3241598 RepID=UPI0035327B00